MTVIYERVESANGLIIWLPEDNPSRRIWVRAFRTEGLTGNDLELLGLIEEVYHTSSERLVRSTSYKPKERGEVFLKSLSTLGFVPLC